MRFDARYLLLAGATAITGWSLLVLYAAAFETGGMSVTRDYVEYMTGNTILLRAEFDKPITIALVTGILAAAVVRAWCDCFPSINHGSCRWCKRTTV